MKQIIIDVYRALCGMEPSEDEIQFRLKSLINTYDLIRDICAGDDRFIKTWVEPKMSAPTPTPEPTEALEGPKNGSEEPIATIPPPQSPPQPSNLFNSLKELTKKALESILRFLWK